MTLRTEDLARLEVASRLLVSPLAAPDPETWLCEAGAAVRDLVGGTAVVLQFPTAHGSYFSEDVPDMAQGVLGFVQEVSWDGTRFSDPAVDAWSRLRKERRLETCSWDINDALVRERGFDFRKAAFCGDVMDRHRVADYVALMGDAAEGEAMVWVLHERYGGFPFGERTDGLLRALLPSFRTGLDTLGRLGAHRAALDALAEPLAAFGPDGRELHRNTALVNALAADPEGAWVEGALSRLGSRAARPLWGTGPAPAEDAVRTARAGYTLRATVLPSGLFGADPAVLVTVAVDRAPALPGVETVRERLGLTAREAEVALLLAQGASNADLAARLYIAPATARRHTENVMGKLGLTKRAAIAAALLGIA